MNWIQYAHVLEAAGIFLSLGNVAAIVLYVHTTRKLREASVNAARRAIPGWARKSRILARVS